MSTAPEDFCSQLAAEIGDIIPFKPMAMYNGDGDCVEFHLLNEAFYAKRIDGWVTAYIGEESGDIVGGMIKGVKCNLLKRFPGITFEFKGDRIGVDVLLKGPSYEVGDPTIHKTYSDIIERTKTAQLEVDDLQPA